MGELSIKLNTKLAEQSARLKELQKKKLKEHYHLAKDLGFKAAEAMVLQHWTRENIVKTAQERGVSNSVISAAVTKLPL